METKVEKKRKWTELINQYSKESYSTDCKSTIWKQLLNTAAIYFVCSIAANDVFWFCIWDNI